MSENTVKNLDKRPSVWFTILHAFLSGKTTYRNGDSVKKHVVEMQDRTFNLIHFKEFLRICEINKDHHVMIQYLYSYVYHCMMQVWLQKDCPVKQFGALNIRTSMYLKRQITSDETFSIQCYNSVPRPVDKGIEVDIFSDIITGDEKIYECATTYLLRGNYGPFDSIFRPPGCDKLEQTSHEKQWFLKDQNNLSFGKFSGDTNPIHYLSWYARMNGFKSKFSQPIRVVSKSLELMLEDEAGNTNYRLEYFLKGPVYYDSMITVKYLKKNSIFNFEIYCEGNDRPCIGGSISLDK